MEGFCKVVPVWQFPISVASLLNGIYNKLLNILGGHRLPRHVSRLEIQLGGCFEVTYWSSAMSSLVRVSKREWMSGLERTVSGILTDGSEQGGCCGLFRFDGRGVDSMAF